MIYRLQKLRELRQFLLPIALLPFALFATGCMQQYNQSAFEVHLTNESDTTISVGLFKKGPPMEDGWASPEDVAIYAPGLSGRHWGKPVKPNETIVLGPQQGKFADGSSARVRIYAGTPTVEESIGYTLTDPDRCDILLYPGRSSFTIKRNDRRLVAIQHDQ